MLFLILISIFIIFLLYDLFRTYNKKKEGFDYVNDCSCHRNYIAKYFHDVKHNINPEKYNFNNRPYLPLYRKKWLDDESEMEFRQQKPLYNVLFTEYKELN